MNVVLILTYELGHQPFGLTSAAAWLRREGASVHCQDAAVQHLDKDEIAEADLIGYYVPMHTATRIAAPFIPTIKAHNPRAHVVCFGLYAPMNEKYLRQLGANTILGGELLVAQAIRAYRDYRGICDTMYYRAPAGGTLTEVDFLLEQGGHIVAVEAKSGREYTENWCRGLRAAAELKGLKRRLIVYPHGPVLRTQHGSEVLPFREFCSLLASGDLWPA